jgi:hypothetical protein
MSIPSLAYYSMSDQEEKAKNWETFERHVAVTKRLNTIEREIADIGQILLEVGVCMKERLGSGGEEKIKLAEGQIYITKQGERSPRQVIDPSVFSHERLVGLLRDHAKVFEERKSLAETLRKVGLTVLD